jgi:hypothetical protein
MAVALVVGMDNQRRLGQVVLVVVLVVDQTRIIMQDQELLDKDLLEA